MGSLMDRAVSSFFKLNGGVCIFQGVGGFGDTFRDKFFSEAC